LIGHASGHGPGREIGMALDPLAADFDYLAG
jgi:hypothetical protein